MLHLKGLASAEGAVRGEKVGQRLGVLPLGALVIPVNVRAARLDAEEAVGTDVVLAARGSVQDREVEVADGTALQAALGLDVDEVRVDALLERGELAIQNKALRLGEDIARYVEVPCVAEKKRECSKDDRGRETRLSVEFVRGGASEQRAKGEKLVALLMWRTSRPEVCVVFWCFVADCK